jgi:hypothetical protein
MGGRIRLSWRCNGSWSKSWPWCCRGRGQYLLHENRRPNSPARRHDHDSRYQRPPPQPTHAIPRASPSPYSPQSHVLLEPGVYLPSILGMRLENVYVVTASDVPQYTLLHPTLVRQRRFLKLETLDFIPFQRKMILDDLMTTREMDLLRDYHRKCVDKIEEQCMTEVGRIWLQRESHAWF